MLSKFQKEGWNGRKITLYHCTDENSACLILADKKFIRGSGGSFGGGIYFAETVQDAERKACKKGVVLSSKVEVGISIVCDSLVQPDAKTVAAEGCNSVKGTCLNGNEWIVYDNGLPWKIKVVKGMTSSICQDKECARYGKEQYGLCGKVCQNDKCLMYKKKHRAHCRNKKKKVVWGFSNE